MVFSSARTDVFMFYLKKRIINRKHPYVDNFLLKKV